jgi:hypothetical protein
MSRKIKLSLVLSMVAALSGISPALAAQQVNNFTVDRQYKGPVCISLNSFSNDSFSVQWGSYNKSGKTPSFRMGGLTYIQLQARGNNVPNISFRSSSSASFSQSACPGVMSVIKW